LSIKGFARGSSRIVPIVVSSEKAMVFSLLRVN
jgi:hypothetical protein